MELLILIVLVFIFILFASSVLANQKKQIVINKRIERKLNGVMDLLQKKESVKKGESE